MSVSQLLKSYLEYKRKHTENSTNKSSVNFLLIILLEICTCTYEKNKHYILPHDLGYDVNSDDTDDFIEDAKVILEECEELSRYDKIFLKRAISFIEQNFERGITNIEIRLLGKKRGYKWRDTYFSKVDFFNTKITPDTLLMDELDSYYDGKTDFEFLTGTDTLFQEDLESDNIDWGDWHSKYAQYTYETEIFWIRKK